MQSSNHVQQIPHEGGHGLARFNLVSKATWAVEANEED